MTDARKSRVLFMPEGSVLAHVGRCLAIARALDPKRVEIFFAASGAHADKLQGFGWPVRDVYTRSHSGLLKRLKTGGSAFTAEELVKCVEAERGVLEEVKPDVVVGDFRPSLGISAPTLKSPISYVCVTNAVWTRYCAIELAPPKTWLPTRIFGARRLKWLRKRLPSLEKRIFAHYARPFNAVRRKYGLPELPDLRDCMCSEDFNLVADIPDFFPPAKDIPAHFQYVGPLLWESDASAPDWLERLDRTRKIVYLTMGSTGALERIETILNDLAQAGFQVICTTATMAVPNLPKDCYSTPFAPGMAMCEAADVVVCHAGNGTIYQALSRGKPIVGVPEFHDQEFNMQRVEALELGLRARATHLPGELVQRVREVLNDRRYSKNAMAWKEKYEEGMKSETLNGPKAAARLIESIAGAGALRRGEHGVPSPSTSAN